MFLSAALAQNIKAMDINDAELPECLERLEDGSIRVAGHRVLLFHILDAIYAGHSNDEIEALFPTIPEHKLSQVRDFCLAYPDAMRQYHTEQCESAERLRVSVESKSPSRAELLRRMEARRGAGMPK
jgi:uncharacterized protein (DUF433 family)